MHITSSAVRDGRLDDRFGCRGSDMHLGEMPARSFPFEICDAPQGTASFSVIFDDYDAVPVCGFTWIHWLVAGLKRASLAEDESRTSRDLIQGVNSWHSCAAPLSKEDASAYGGPCPPDKPHEYSLEVFALDADTRLRNGFMLNDLMREVDGHAIARCKLRMAYYPR
ncbi:MAG: YbhB/YbcL family Raf kinase inhibitor-like protein [Candidatus Methanoplasma sp.]|nr:YbhB/YbcL family Raf kinase inhibitor-like protein [Candidatus Methanoplasma sp.]